MTVRFPTALLRYQQPPQPYTATYPVIDGHCCALAEQWDTHVQGC